MSRRNEPSNTERVALAADSGLSLRHLRRETRTALELAVVALAPTEILDHLAASAGLLEALVELPDNSPPALALAPGLVERTRKALDEWQSWQKANLDPKMPRG